MEDKLTSATLKDKNLDKMIEVQQKFFKWYDILSFITPIITLFTAFAVGIIDAKFKLWIGIGLRGFGTWFLWTLIGGAIGTIEYFIAKIALSQKKLTVLYLQKLNEYKK